VETLEEVHGPHVVDDGTTGETSVETLEEVHGPHVEEGDEDEDEVETGRTGVLNESDNEPPSWARARAKAKRPTVGMRGR
jgi:hypothetical protein